MTDGGLFVTYTGKYYLDQIMRVLGEHLTYRWMICSPWEARGSLIASLNVESNWKPILIYSKGDWKERDRWSDLIRGPKEKEWHDWQQPVAEVESTDPQYFSNPGDLVVDPCGGGFTTAAACSSLGDRRCIACDNDGECVRKGQERLAEAAKERDARGTP